MTQAVSASAPAGSMPSAVSAGGGGSDPSYSGREKGADVRHYNIVAARAVADVIRTSLGPKGMDKVSAE